jgi:hypothetical protein
MGIDLLAGAWDGVRILDAALAGGFSFSLRRWFGRGGTAKNSIEQSD